jgi:hypothetical protein
MKEKHIRGELGRTFLSVPPDGPSSLRPEDGRVRTATFGSVLEKRRQRKSCNLWQWIEFFGVYKRGDGTGNG